jgi:tetratricopeptide (TPR) repeat protein
VYFRHQYVCFLTAIAIPLAGGTKIDAANRLAEAFGTPPITEDADGPAVVPRPDKAARDQRRAGDLAQETALRRRALRQALATFGPKSLATAQAITSLALAHIDRRRWLDAEPLLILAARMLPEIHQDRLEAMIFAGLARVALSRGDADAALAFARRAVESTRRDPHGASAEPLRALGAALAALERLEEARQAVEEALALDRRRHGTEAAETARSLSQLGNLYLRWDRPEDALEPFQQATAIDQMQLGPAHPFIADDLYDLGIAYDALNRPDQARRMLLAALSVLERGTERDTPRAGYVERALGRVEQQLGDAAAAEMAQSEARRILDKAEAEERRRERRS